MGDVMVDVIVRQLDRLAVGSDTESAIRLAPGGSAANQAAHLALAGASVDFFGVVGEDGLGDSATQALEAVGVRPHLEVAPGRSTGVVVSLVDHDGQRSMLTDRAANAELARIYLPEHLCAPGHHLHLSGYELLHATSRPAALALIDRAERAGMSCSVDPCSAAPLVRAGAAAFLSWTRDFAFCCANLDEARVLSGERDPERAVEVLARYYDEVTVTLGGDGALWAGRTSGQLRLASRAVQVHDTTGAGDAFTGTFLARRLVGDAPADALSAGLEAAARVVSTAGARSWR
ncbi:MAG: PfkB family carbohydrate kinase [Actinomycetota bacterium]|nr:PfkB family carbohydrate kinase [Actinomycetota bacterium]